MRGTTSPRSAPQHLDRRLGDDQIKTRLHAGGVIDEGAPMNAVVTLAGSVSTAVFVASALPMLWKAGRTRDLSSYSIGNIALANIGNAIYAIYVFSLPFGPIWVLHGFHGTASGLMLMWYLRQHVGDGARPPDNDAVRTTAATEKACCATTQGISTV
ncbi:hypothetical protein [Gordonia rhizosphera]|uniref:hypothetical protein n=1 Tax=Gordonia rhizosphera TaxID=83341 RepID=UPI003571382A